MTVNIDTLGMGKNFSASWMPSQNGFMGSSYEVGSSKTNGLTDFLGPQKIGTTIVPIQKNKRVGKKIMLDRNLFVAMCNPDTIKSYLASWELKEIFVGCSIWIFFKFVGPVDFSLLLYIFGVLLASIDLTKEARKRYFNIIPILDYVLAFVFILFLATAALFLAGLIDVISAERGNIENSWPVHYGIVFGGSILGAGYAAKYLLLIIGLVHSAIDMPQRIKGAFAGALDGFKNPKK